MKTPNPETESRLHFLAWQSYSRLPRSKPGIRDSSADLGCIVALLFLSPAIAFFTLILYLAYIVFFIDGARNL